MNKEDKKALSGFINLVFLLVVGWLLIDMFGAFMWFLSGQSIPFNSYYIGKLTREIIVFIINLIK